MTKTQAERDALYNQRADKQGLARVSLRVPVGRVDEFKALAEQARKEHRLQLLKLK